MRDRKTLFVDSGAWIALALTRDPLHNRARETWNQIMVSHKSVYTSVPVVLETFTFLDRNTAREVANRWKDTLYEMAGLHILDCTASDLRDAWAYLERKDLHKLSAVDATSFSLMRKHGIKRAFAFDHHFASVGFLLVG